MNDSLGHRAGDELLKEVARRLKGVVRNVDTVARLGGDEFVLIVSPGSEQDSAQHVAQRIIDAMHAPVSVAGIELHTSPSIGIAFYPRDGTNIELLLAHADAAMYCAKQRGRNNFQCFTPDMTTAAQEKVRLETDLHVALEPTSLNCIISRRSIQKPASYTAPRRCCAGGTRCAGKFSPVSSYTSRKNAD